MLSSVPRSMTPTHAWRGGPKALSAMPFAALGFAFFVAAVVAGCVPKAPAATPTATPLAPVHAEVTWEDQSAWMLRLEDRRLLRDPNPPEPAVLRPATATTPALLAARPPADLLRLLEDRQPRVRRRAALAVGRVGLAEGAAPLMTRLLNDEDPEVRQMAAFALGLLADPATRGALLAAFKDADPVVQGRAAEALGRIGDKSDAAAVAAMVKRHVAGGAIAAIAADDLAYPQPPPAEAVRLGLYALVRFGVYDALAEAVIDSAGRPVSAWWPVAFALQRIGDARAVPALLSLAETESRYTVSFALRGLASAKAAAALPLFRRHVEQRRADRAVVVQSMRGLAQLGDASAIPGLLAHVTSRTGDATLRAEAMGALVPLVGADQTEWLVDLTSDRVPAVRGDALRALARVDPDTFMATLSGLDLDPDPRVRVALAAALGTVGPDRVGPLLSTLANDMDPRVAAEAMRAVVAAKAGNAEALLIARLQAGDFAVRATAASLLAEMKAVGSIEALKAAHARSMSDDSFVARAATLSALRQLDPAAATPLLRAALTDRDWAVRVRAGQLLRELGESPDPAAARPAPSRRAVDDPAWAALVSPQFSPHVYLEMDRGTIEIELAVLDAPLTAANFIELARKGHFDGVAFHRVVPDFVIQGGDPRGDGEGGPGYTIRDEINQRPYLRGTVGMALDWKDTGGSQFFITHAPQPHLDGGYTVFGHVVAGMDVVDQVMVGDVVRRVRVWDGVTATR